MELINEVNSLLPEKLEYRSTLSDIITDGDTDLANETWGEHAIEAYEKLGNYVKDIKTSYSLLKDWYMGHYTRIPFRIVASIAGAMLYLVSPLDVMPDWLPFGGLLDDALVLAAVFAMSRKDLDRIWDGKIVICKIKNDII